MSRRHLWVLVAIGVLSLRLAPVMPPVPDPRCLPWHCDPHPEGR